MRGKRLVETQYLQTLVEVVRSGSFSKAAERLCITQSAVSRRIRFMEEQYGHPLVDRSGPVVVATPAGDLVIETSRQILEAERGLLCGLTSLTGRRGIRFACTSTFGTCFLPQILDAYLALKPSVQDLNFHFDAPGAVLRGIQDGRIDVAVIEHCDSFVLPDLPAVSLPADEMVFVSHAASRLPPTIAHVDRVLDNTLLARAEGCCSRTLLDANMRRQGRSVLDFRKVVVMDDPRLIIESVVVGNGIAFTSNDLVASQIADERLKGHRVAGFRHNRCRTLVFGAGVRDQDKSDFTAILKESLAPGIAEGRLGGTGLRVAA
jgi:DNA-binding transcriptional LysR family regulator